MESQKNLNSQSNLKKEEQSWRHHIPDFKLYYKAIEIKTVQYWHKDRSIDQWNRIESGNKSTKIWSITLQQRSQEYIIGNKQSLQVSSINHTGETMIKCRRTKQPYLTPHTKINSK